MPINKNNNIFEKTSFLGGNSSKFIEELYANYLEDPQSISIEWKDFFKGLNDKKEDILKTTKGPSWNPQVKKKIKLKIDPIQIDQHNNQEAIIVDTNSEKEKEQSVKAIALIRAYRIRGHLIAKLDPLEMMERKYLEDLHPADHGFKKEDYNKKIYVGAYMQNEYVTINEILSFFRKTYCSTIGVEYMHISDPVEKVWFRERMEKKPY